ncbi:PAS domain-containing protein, partial [Kitasatospora sp. NPDC047058]|uniref:PAS domain-containing protein n=1 Tax=Kitasatospora sp. NPDC047058 TaxID=3155620 RepID=UPI0033D8D351
MVDEPNSTPRPAATAAGPAAVPGDLPSGVVALVRLALVLVDRSGRIALWSRAAEELFGHRAEVTCDRPAAGLLPVAGPRGVPGPAGRRRDALESLAELTAGGRPWAGQMPVTDREDHPRDVLWWAYPSAGDGLLVLAADARPLRSAGPRLALGERLLPFAPVSAARGGFHRLSAALAPPGRPVPEPLARLLPAGSAARREQLLERLGLAGLPALRLDRSTVLPVLPADPPTATAHVAAGIGRRYPTAQQRASEPEPGEPGPEAPRLGVPGVRVPG